MNAIENLLRREIGLDAASVGSSLIERTIRLRMKTLGLAKPAEYLALLATSPPEWEELIEAVVITETWFFREEGSFTALVQLVQQELMTQTASEVVRILSLPCATGEEPYSLAMALLDAGVPRHRFVVEAVDLSARALERARKAIYGKNSFRGRTLEFRERHFTPAGEGWKLQEAVRQSVQFRRGNLLDEKLFTGRAAYDFIFCRNLLIYFDRDTQALTLGTLKASLAARGYLFVSPAEMPLVSVHGFVSAGLPMAFACRPACGTTDLTDRRAEPPSRPARGRTSCEFRVASSDPACGTERGTRNAERGSGNLELGTLAAARALADAGQLAEAIALCEAHVKVAGPSAQAYYLLGLVTEARENAELRSFAEPRRLSGLRMKNEAAPAVAGKPSGPSSFYIPPSSLVPAPGALDYYRKALYLEPNHYETLLQMSLLLEKTGDTTGARRFQRRVERLKLKNSEESPSPEGFRG